MKTIYYLFIALFIGLMLTSATQKASDNHKIIILQASESKVSSQLLTQSATIIKERLKTCRLESEVSIITDKGQIKVQISDKIMEPEIERLLTTRGELGFYETLTVKELAGKLNDKDLHNQLKYDPNISSSDARLGCSSFENHSLADSIENCLKAVNLNKEYKLLWGLKNSKLLTCLYALKTGNGGTAILGRKDIEYVKSSMDKKSGQITIELKFKKEAAGTWATTTKNSLGKPVAIVLDDKVFYSPVVNTTMENGLCEITGNFTEKEVNYFLAIVNHDQLPADFKIR
jgi:preprotein translocase subunit SecD